MLKPSRVLVDAEGEAAVPYEETRLAKRAPASRRRLASVLVVGALTALVESFVSASGLWLLVVALALLAAWGVRQGRLGGVVGAALLALFALLLPLRPLLTEAPEASAVVALVVSMVLGAACIPDVVLLLRDAELQYAYGRWARRV